MAAGPLLTGDPERIGAHRLVGRLGTGGQGVVYLAETASGEKVAVKLLRSGADEDSSAAFGREIELVLRVKDFCTARVLEHGEFGGAPYLVSEYVDGPSLAQAISGRGPLRGAELRRLATGMLTALAAIHRAGVVHRDLKPANVLLGRDGPRVIDFGIARAADAADTVTGRLVGTPPYMAPEQFSGVRAGPASDMFAWAATVTCAATGAPPFGTGPVPVTVHRILSAEPDLGELDGELRDLVLQCLSKDPAARPTATAALLRLLGHAEASRRLPAERPGPATPPDAGGTRPVPRTRNRRRIAAAVAAAALVPVCWAAVHLARTADGPPRGDPATARRTAGGPARPGATGPTGRGRAGGTMAPASTATVRIPGTEVFLHEDPGDSWHVASYQSYREDRTWGPSYLRARGGTSFERIGGLQEVVVSSTGAHAVVSPHVKTDLGTFDQVRILDRATGKEITVQTAERPTQTRYPRWSPDGARVLLTAFRTEGQVRMGRSEGFVIVDAAAGSARIVRVADDNDGPHPYAWGPDGTTVIQRAPGGAVRVRNLDGTLVRTLSAVGEATGDDVAVSPLGPVVTTVCPGEPGRICLWDYTTGARRAAVRLPGGAVFGGWLGGRNLLATKTRRGTGEVVMLGLDGAVVRVLARGPAAELRRTALSFASV
ncbi:serine/threonine protein kinase-like protein [Planomonospora sphaerica]|uniref:Serine/threonine protein kinase-like protein n=1 Tax=Planomonospora sphaerica TaxID=161355 RepID=A0A171DHL4_9ACTN|nr:serine/threonine-protein kinase [Planomonospora sphaerica]GAT68529.1 serine/threonine protein kinase-like protein [Planomonospora sphaerica]